MLCMIPYPSKCNLQAVFFGALSQIIIFSKSNIKIDKVIEGRLAKDTENYSSLCYCIF